MPGVKDLKEFIAYAENNRKYAKQTAKGKRVALKLFEAELNEDEAQSLDLFHDRLEKIYQAVHQRNKTTIKASSLAIYKSRVQGLLKDYKKYGSDPNALNSWDTTRKHEPKVKRSAKPVFRSGSGAEPIEAEVVHESASFLDSDEIRKLMATSGGGVFNSELNRFEVYLRPGFKVSLTLPIDLTKTEAERLKHMIDGMVTQHGDNNALQEVSA